MHFNGSKSWFYQRKCSTIALCCRGTIVSVGFEAVGVSDWGRRGAERCEALKGFRKRSCSQRLKCIVYPVNGIFVRRSRLVASASSKTDVKEQAPSDVEKTGNDEKGRSLNVLQERKDGKNDIVVGNLYLLAVAFLWGSYSPTLKGLFNLDGAPSPLIIAAARGCLQTLLLSIPLVASGVLKSDMEESGVNSTYLQNRNRQANLFSLSPAIVGALEIGAYNTMGTLCQTWGLSLSSATRSAFLVQATALWTPLLSAAFGMVPSPLLWLSSFIALGSTAFVTLDQAQVSSSSLNSVGPGLESFATGVSVGDLTILASAFFYSLSTVRIPKYANKMPPIQLAFGKSAVLAVVALVSLTYVILNDASTQGLSIQSIVDACYRLWPGASWNQTTAFILLAWSASGPGALSAFLHIKGQSMVSPTDAQVVFATVPLWSALLAALFLPGEHVGTLTWVGGAGMLLAGLVAALGSVPNADEKDTGK